MIRLNGRMHGADVDDVEFLWGTCGPVCSDFFAGIYDSEHPKGPLSRLEGTEKSRPV